MENFIEIPFSLFQEENILSEVSRLFIKPESPFMRSHQTNLFSLTYITITRIVNIHSEVSQHWYYLHFTFYLSGRSDSLLTLENRKLGCGSLAEWNIIKPPHWGNHWVAMGNLVRWEGDWGQRETPVSKMSRHMTKRKAKIISRLKQPVEKQYKQQHYIVPHVSRVSMMTENAERNHGSILPTWKISRTWCRRRSSGKKQKAVMWRIWPWGGCNIWAEHLKSGGHHCTWKEKCCRRLMPTAQRWCGRQQQERRVIDHSFSPLSDVAKWSWSRGQTTIPTHIHAQGRFRGAKSPVPQMHDFGLWEKLE